MTLQQDLTGIHLPLAPEYTYSTSSVYKRANAAAIRGVAEML